MLITICSWDDFNPRKDLKSMPWIRLEAGVAHSRKLFGLGADQKWLWVVLLALAAQQNKGGTIDADLDYLSHYSDLPPDRILDALEKFKCKGLLTIESDRERPGPVPDTIDLSVATIESVPNERNGTERTERTERNGTNGTNGTNSSAGASAKPPSARKEPRALDAPKPGWEVWLTYSAAYERRYGHAPPRNAKNNALSSQLVQRLGADDAKKVVAFYLTHNDAFYVRTVHPLDACVKNAEGLRTQMLAGHRVTASEAANKDRQQGNLQAFSNVLRKLEAEQKAGGDS